MLLYVVKIFEIYTSVNLKNLLTVMPAEEKNCGHN